MPNPYYKSLHWRRLRALRLAMDQHTCVVPGCGQRAVVVDHIRSRTKGGADTIKNTRSLCREHDNAIKERANGKRANDGVLRVKGCFADGTPRDPNHAWYTGGNR
jgi:5-methylcytosine-specific restriction endonuclease McrA